MKIKLSSANSKCDNLGLALTTDNPIIWDEQSVFLKRLANPSEHKTNRKDDNGSFYLRPLFGQKNFRTFSIDFNIIGNGSDIVHYQVHPSPFKSQMK